MECAVCYEPIGSPLKLSCKHSFCRKCIEEWYISSPAEVPGCPTCRREMRGSVVKCLEEARTVKKEDAIFGQVLDEYLDEWCEFINDFEPEEWDHRMLMEDLSKVQQTVKALSECQLDEEDILEFVDFAQWQTWKPFAPKGWIAWDPPSQKFFDEHRRTWRSF